MHFGRKADTMHLLSTDAIMKSKLTMKIIHCYRCAGITMYEPLIYHKAGSEHVKRVGIVGGGGLGHMVSHLQLL
jgi:D-arabinose 1-dehydrogenase-like Zn-dependent alcohol dehydrogenase